MDVNEYIKEHALWGMVAFVCFRCLVFRCIPGMKYIQSISIFISDIEPNRWINLSIRDKLLFAKKIIDCECLY